MKVLKLILGQYQSSHRYDGKFNGWDWSGGGISQSGSEFSITDRHFVSMLLKQALSKCYESNRDRAWKFIIKNCIARNETEVSKDRPDFLNRAVIDILVKEYAKPEHKKEVFEILSNFIRMRKGIPWKADLVFQRLRGDFTNEQNEQKWALVKVGLDEYKNLPINVFVEQITSDLAAKGHKEAVDTIAGWVMNPEYHKRQTIGSFNVVGNISKLLDNSKTFEEGVAIFKNYLFSKEFIEKDNDWETWDVAKTLAKVISTEPEIGISILKDIYSSTRLTQNQQTLICSSINDLPKENKALLEKVYQDFVYPLLESLDGDTSKVEKRITNRYSREQIVQFAEKLAENRLYDGALYIIKVFINDSDPILENYPDDPKGDFNYHQKVIEGDDNPTLSTVRGYCAWVLQKFCIRYGRDYIPKILDLVEKLTKDPNYFVRVQSCIPLLALVKSRHTVLSENNKERFLPTEVAERIENITFAMLTDKENHKLKAVMKHLAMVFSYMRSLDEKRAMKILQVFKNISLSKEKSAKEIGMLPVTIKSKSLFAEVMDEIAPLFIYYAEFRKEAFKNERSMVVFGAKGWKELNKFDEKPFKDLLFLLLKSTNPEVRRIFAWQFERLPNENKEQLNQLFDVAYRYLLILTENYDHDVFNNIYRFIEEYIGERFDECFNLWKKCIDKEKKYFDKNYNKERLQDMYWWPFFYNGKVLLKIAEVKGEGEFLTWFKKLADYPTDLLIANDLDLAVEYLITIKTHKKQVEKLFLRLMERNSKYYVHKQKWMQNEN